MCLSVSACFVPIQTPLQNGREEPEADTVPSLHLPARGSLLSSPFSPALLRSPLSSPCPPSLRSGLRASLGCHVTAAAWGELGGRDDSQQGRKFLGVFFLPPFSAIWPQCLRHQRPLGGPAAFPLVNSHGQEEARLLLLYFFHFRNLMPLLYRELLTNGQLKGLGYKFKILLRW